jgi:hypothetical protein
MARRRRNAEAREQSMTCRIAVVPPLPHRPGEDERNIAEWQRLERHDTIYPRPPCEAAE